MSADENSPAAPTLIVGQPEAGDNPKEPRKARKQPDAKAIFGVALTLFGLFVCWVSLHESAVYEDQVAENLTIRAATGSLLAGAAEVAGGARGFGATGQETFLNSFREGEEFTAKQLEILDALTRNLPEQGMRLRRVGVLIGVRLQIARETVAERTQSGTPPPPDLLVRGERAMEQVRKGIREMEDDQRKLLDQYENRARLARGGATAIVLLSLSTGIWMLFAATVARQHAQEELWLLKAALQAAANAVMITDRTGIVEWINPAFSDLTGYTVDEVVGRSSSFLRSGKHPPGFYREMWETILSGRVWNGELINKRKDGSFYSEEMTITPVRSEGCGYTHFVAIKQDITEKRQLEDKFRQAQKMEGIGTLAGGVAHDFNNWLTVIRGNVDIIDDLLGGDLLYLNEIQQIRLAADSAGTLTKQLLAFSRKQVLQPRVISPNVVVADTAKLLDRLLGEDIFVRLELSPVIDNVRVDPSQLQEVILNLAVNARDAMPKGGTLSISTSNCEVLSGPDTPHVLRPGQYVRLHLQDTGSGMDAITLGRAFEPFFTTKPQGKGTGLGLATVYGIVKQSDGCVFLNSEPGKGTGVEVFLPSVDQEVTTDCDTTPIRPAGGTESILVVEDNEPLRRLIYSGLLKNGYKPLVAGSGEEALTQLRDRSVDLLITDCILPGMDGADLARRLKRDHPKLNILYMSGHPEETLGDKGAVDPNVVFLQKPFAMPALLRMVRKALEAPASTLAS